MNVRLATTAVLAGTLALTACSGASSAQTAASVDGRVITEETLMTATEQLNTALKPQQPITAEVVLTAMIRAPYINDMVAAKGQPISESQAREALASLPGEPDPAVIEVLRAEANAQKLDQASGQQLTEKLRGLKVSVNPRFGTYNPTEFAVGPDAPNWIVPSAQPSPSAPPQ